MEWINNLLNGENSSAVNLVLITLALAFLLIVLVWVFKKISGTATRRAMRSRVPRLLITDSATVDEKRFLVMVRRDNVEHLLLIGGANDLVVESNIVRAQSANPATNSSQAQAVRSSEAAIENNASVAKQQEAEKTPSAPVAAVTTAGAAGLAGMASSVNATASSVKETVADTTSNVSQAVSDTSSKAAEGISDLASASKYLVADAASDTTNAVMEVANTSVEEVISTLDSAKDALSASTEVDMPEIAVTDTSVAGAEIETADMDISLESQISATLDDALSMDSLDLDISQDGASNETSASEVASNDADDGSQDDDMKRLLDELSKEMKEPA